MSDAEDEKPKVPRTQRGTFAKGSSGNPAGAKGKHPEVRAFLAEKTLLAAEVLVVLLDSEDDKVAAQAAKTILEFTIAKPKEAPEALTTAAEAIERLADALTTKD